MTDCCLNRSDGNCKSLQKDFQHGSIGGSGLAQSRAGCCAGLLRRPGSVQGQQRGHRLSLAWLHGPATGVSGVGESEVEAGALCFSDSNERIFEVLRGGKRGLACFCFRSCNELWGSAALARGCSAESGSSSYLQFREEEENTREVLEAKGVWKSPPGPGLLSSTAIPVLPASCLHRRPCLLGTGLRSQHS